MSREWKPGDVAMLEVGCHANRHVGVFVGDGWRYSGGGDKWVSRDPAIVTARPLVVIDPEDRAPASRLIRAYLRECGGGGPIIPTLEEVDNMRAALREFANPTPPKPAEPTAMWSVVVDDREDQWVRVLGPDFEDGWVRAGDLPSNGKWTDYADISAVRVLSEGVS